MEIDDSYWDQRIENAKSFEGKLEDIPEDKEYEENMTVFVDEIYKVKCALEVLITEFSDKDGFKNEVTKLKKVINEINSI